MNWTISNIVLAIAFLVIAMAIMNTVFMAVAERTREFGVMMAVAHRRPRSGAWWSTKRWR